jgi:hypothetical protein
MRLNADQGKHKVNCPRFMAFLDTLDVADWGQPAGKANAPPAGAGRTAATVDLAQGAAGAWAASSKAMLQPTHLSSQALAPQPLSFDPDLVRKYDGFGPRYTSYPTADRFTEAFGPDQLVEALWSRLPLQPLSLYIHVPFCNTICYYCACNKVVTKDHGRSAKYIRYLTKEVAIAAALLDGGARVKQLHLGGGTPTFLSSDEMAHLVRVLEDQFAFDGSAQRSIEVDPRTVNAETVSCLAAAGFNRMSLGVQDFDPRFNGRSTASRAKPTRSQ